MNTFINSVLLIHVTVLNRIILTAVCSNVYHHGSASAETVHIRKDRWTLQSEVSLFTMFCKMFLKIIGILRSQFREPHTEINTSVPWILSDDELLWRQILDYYNTVFNTPPEMWKQDAVFEKLIYKHDFTCNAKCSCRGCKSGIWLFQLPLLQTQGKWIKLHQEIKKCRNTQIPEWSYTTTGKDHLVCFTSWIWIGNLWYTVPSSSTSFVNMSHWTFPCGRWRCQACVVTDIICTWSGDFTSMHKATTGSICTCTPLIIATKCLWSINPYICAQTWPSLSLM
jgi:hypothetical protein